MPDVAASGLFKATDTKQHHCLDNKASWPVSHRGGVYHFTDATADDGTVTVRVKAVPR